jgi:hypothetical protein
VAISSSFSESDNEDESHEEIGDIALFVNKYHKGLNKEEYKVVKRRFLNKKKRTCYNCGSTQHFIVLCPREKKENKQYKKEGRKGFDNNRKYRGEAHIGHQWDLSKDSSNKEGEKVATIAIQESSIALRLFKNLSNDDSPTPHICLIAKHEEIKPKSTSLSSSSSRDSSDNESSDDEMNAIMEKLDGKTKEFITKLLGELASVKDELDETEDVLIKEEDLYIDNKKALALERSEKELSHNNLAKEQGEHAMLKRKFEELKLKYDALDKKHVNPKTQYSVLFDSCSKSNSANDSSSQMTIEK